VSATLRSAASIATWSPTDKLRVLGGLRADAYVLGAAIAQHFSKAFALELQFDGAVQRGGLVATTAEQIIPRHSLVLRFVAREPERQAARW